jgi:hypothetical protein
MRKASRSCSGRGWAAAAAAEFVAGAGAGRQGRGVTCALRGGGLC